MMGLEGKMKGSPYTTALLLPLVLVAASACSGKKPGAAARPQEMTANEALAGGVAGDVKCAASDDDKTLIVDLEATDR